MPSAKPQIRVVASPEQKAAWEARAQAAGVSLSTLIAATMEEASARPAPASLARASRSGVRPPKCDDRFGDHAQARKTAQGLRCRACGQKVFK